MLDSQIAAAVDEATDLDNHLQPPLPTCYAGAARELERLGVPGGGAGAADGGRGGGVSFWLQRVSGNKERNSFCAF